MPATFLPNTPVSGKLTVRFEWVADTQKATDIATQAAELIIRGGGDRKIKTVTRSPLPT